MIQPTDRYSRWIAMLAQSDRNLVLLGEIAVVTVIAYQLLGRLPAPWAARVRVAFLWASGGVLLVLLAGLHPTMGQIMVLGFALAVGLAIAKRARGWVLASMGPVEYDEEGVQL